MQLAVRVLRRCEHVGNRQTVEERVESIRLTIAVATMGTVDAEVEVAVDAAVSCVFVCGGDHACD